MKSKIRSFTVAERNAADGVSMAQTAEGALGEVHDVLGSADHAVGIYVMRVDAPGRRFAWRHMNVYHVRNGKIVEVWSNPFEQDEFDAFFA